MLDPLDQSSNFIIFSIHLISFTLILESFLISLLWNILFLLTYVYFLKILFVSICSFSIIPCFVSWTQLFFQYLWVYTSGFFLKLSSLPWSLCFLQFLVSLFGSLMLKTYRYIRYSLVIYSCNVLWTLGCYHKAIR